MKRYIIAIVAAAAIAFSANAQPYDNSVGLVLGPTIGSGSSSNSTYAGVQWNHFLSEKNHIDTRVLYNNYWGGTLDAMYDWDFPFSSVNGLSLYLGPGINVGYVKDYNGLGDNCACFGFTAAAGLEYVFSGLPVALSFDWHPYMTWEPKLSGSKPGFGFAGVDLCVKYCF